MINTFLYSVYGQGGGTRHIDDAGITEVPQPVDQRRGRRERPRRDRDARRTGRDRGDRPVARQRPDGKKSAPSRSCRSSIPPIPDSASASGSITKAAAFEKLCADWNQALTKLKPLVTPDEARALVKYGTTITDEEKVVVPAVDLPAGLPRFMIESAKTWASRLGDTVDAKRGSITVKVPKGFRDWPVIPG